MTGVEVIRAESRIPQAHEINDLVVLANHLGQSGYFKDARTGYQAFAKLLFGRDLGLSATAAMTGVHIIEGKPEISANVQAQMVKTYVGPEGERYDYRVLEHSGDKCRIEFSRRRDGEWQPLGVSEYTMNDARTAGLANKPTWQRHPRNMLFARAMSDGVAFHCPEVTHGIRTYHEGEIDVDGTVRNAAPPSAAEPQMIPVAGDVVDGAVADPPPATPAAALPKALVDELVATKRAANAPEEWVRKQLVAVGVEDVPDGNVSLKTIRQLTPDQASGLLDAFNDRIASQQASHVD